MIDPGTHADLQSIKLIFYAQVTTLAILGGVVYLLIENEMLGDGNIELAVLLQPVIIVIVPAMLAAAYFLFKMMMKRIDPALPLRDKLQSYLRASIIRTAFFEFIGISLAVIALLTGEILLLATLPILLLLVLFLRPTIASVSHDLQLNTSERDELSAPKL